MKTHSTDPGYDELKFYEKTLTPCIITYNISKETKIYMKITSTILIFKIYNTYFHSYISNMFMYINRLNTGYM